MTREDIKKLLERQLELLSERSKTSVTNVDLDNLTYAMISLADFLKSN